MVVRCHTPVSRDKRQGGEGVRLYFFTHLQSLLLALPRAHFRPLLLVLLALGLFHLVDDPQKLLEAVVFGLPLHLLEAAPDDVLGQTGGPQEAGGVSLEYFQLGFFIKIGILKLSKEILGYICI